MQSVRIQPLFWLPIFVGLFLLALYPFFSYAPTFSFPMPDFSQLTLVKKPSAPVPVASPTVPRAETPRAVQPEKPAPTPIAEQPIHTLSTGAPYTPPAMPAVIPDAPKNEKRSFFYSFETDGELLSATSMPQSSSPYFWVSSGGRMVIQNGIGSTLAGTMPTNDPAHKAYAKVNPLDTDGGKHPQNTFRLVTKSVWGNADQRIAFRITNQNLTNTPNRDGYSGIFLMNRYADKDNLYYAGIRDDGQAIIKKKIGGKYYTLGSVQVFGKKGQYHKTKNPSLLPSQHWMGMKSRVVNNADGSATITLMLDYDATGAWKTVLSAKDTGVGGKVLSEAGHGGLRTDYKDVEFDNFEFREL